jgi:lipopolysaccharide transport system permease protein
MLTSQVTASHARIRIRPPGRLPRLQFGELWRYRELLYFLAWRDIKVRYKQAAIGVVWALVQPALMMVIFTIFLGRVAKVPSEGLPYPVFVFAGLLPWTFFANSVAGASDSVVGNANLVSKVYFPRLAIPVAALLAWVPDVLIASSMLLVLMLVYGIAPAWTVFALPLFLALAMAAAFSVGIWLSALNVAYRDVRYAVPFLLQAWLFATPVVYPAAALPERFQLLYGLNPMTGVIEGFRWSLLGTTAPSIAMTSLSLLVIAALLVSGVVYFRHVEHFFADVI